MFPMPPNQPHIIVTTGVDDMKEKMYERIWKIRNFDLIAKNEKLIEQEHFKIETGQDSISSCSFLIGLSKQISNKNVADIAPYCQLLEAKGILGTSIDVTFYAEARDRNDDVYFRRSLPTDLKIGGKADLHHFPSVQEMLSKMQDHTTTFCIKLILHRHAVESKQSSILPQNLEQRFYSHLHDNLVKLLANQGLSDVVIITSDDVLFHGHRTILQMQNPVFASLFQFDCVESKSGIIKVEDVSSKVMELILRFIYTGDILPNWSDPSIVVEFTYAAGKYQLTEILNMLDDTLGDDSSQEYSTCYVSLLSLANKLMLKRAAARLLKQFAKLTGNAQTAEEMLALLNLN